MDKTFLGGRPRTLVLVVLALASEGAAGSEC